MLSDGQRVIDPSSPKRSGVVTSSSWREGDPYPTYWVQWEGNSYSTGVNGGPLEAANSEKASA